MNAYRQSDRQRYIHTHMHTKAQSPVLFAMLSWSCGAQLACYIVKQRMFQASVSASAAAFSASRAAFCSLLSVPRAHLMQSRFNAWCLRILKFAWFACNPLNRGVLEAPHHCSELKSRPQPAVSHSMQVGLLVAVRARFAA